MNKITLVMILGLSPVSAVFSSEIEVKKGDTIDFVPPMLSKAFAVTGVATVKEKVTPTSIYRDGKLRVEIEEIVRTITRTGKEPTVSNITIISLYAKGREVMRIENDDKRPRYVDSPWPIKIEHGANLKKGGITYYNIIIPKIDFYEYLEFKDGELQPLLEDDRYTFMRDAHFELAVEILEGEPTKRVR